MQAEGHHIVDDGLTTAQHQALDAGKRLGGSSIVATREEREARPLVGNLTGRKLVVPSKASEGIPVALRHDVAAPRGAVADIRHGTDGGEF